MNRSHPQMVSDLKKPGQDILNSLTPTLASAAHMLTGVYDEHLELAVELRTISTLRPHEEEFAEVLKNATLEAGDLFFYLQGLHQDLVGTEIPEKLLGEIIEEFTYAERLMGDVLDLLRDNVLKAATIAKRHIYYGKPFDADSLTFEIARVGGIALAVLDKYDVSPQDVLELNKQKLLGSRYKEGKFSNEQANERKDEGTSSK